MLITDFALTRAIIEIEFWLIKTHETMKHGIVIPCYNEAERLDSSTFIKFLKTSKNHEICFVNDGSKDSTLEVLKEIRKAANTDNVHIYNMSSNGGKAEAVRQGSLYLEERTAVDTIGFLDADLSTTFDDYDELCKSMENSNGQLKMVIGSRNLLAQGIERNPIRNMLSKIVGLLISFIVRIKVADTQCGAKVFHRDIIPLAYGNSFISRWLFDIEIILRLKKRMGAKPLMSMFKEQALKSWIHADGSKLDTKDSLMIPFNLLSIWSNYELKPVFSTLSYHINTLTSFSSVSNFLRKEANSLQLNEPQYSVNNAV